jgi:hypothetical protein
MTYASPASASGIFDGDRDVSGTSSALHPPSKILGSKSNSNQIKQIKSKFPRENPICLPTLPKPVFSLVINLFVDVNKVNFKEQFPNGG